MKIIFLFPFILISFSSFGQFDDRMELTDNIMQPNAIEFNDLDQDSDIDLVIISNGDGNIYWKENLGNLTFSSPKLIGDSVSQGSAAIVDLNNDGFKDVVCSSALGWFKNLGNNNFEPNFEFISNNGAALFIKAGDMDGDGDFDLVSGYSNKIVWFKNLGNANFSAEINIETSNYAFNLKKLDLCDVDNDTDLDIISAAYQQDFIGIYRNNGVGLFTTVPITQTLNGPVDFELKDIDGNGFIDLCVVSNVDNKISLIKNNGLTGFAAPVNVGSVIMTGTVGTVKASDIDGDGDLDILYNNNSVGGGWNKVINQGNANFGNESLIIPYPASFYDTKYIHDLDLDGDDDMVNIDFTNSNINLYQNDQGVYSFFSNLTPNTISNFHTLLRDIDGDGKVDVVAHAINGLCWYKNLDNGNFSSPVYLGNGYPLSYIGYDGMDINDLDFDGDMDIVYSTAESLIWLENDGNGIFQNSQLIDDAGGFNFESRISIVDIDNDTDFDILSIRGYTIGWYENLGSASFSSLQIINNTLANHDVASSDLDADGDQEIITFTTNQSPSYLYIKMNLGSGVFGSNQILQSFSSDMIYDFIIFDINNDGLDDIMSSVFINPGYTINCNINMGGGTFALTTPLLSFDASNSRLSHLDVDNDGDEDLIFFGGVNTSGEIRWSENIGNGVFTQLNLIDKIYHGYNCLDHADVDSDGDQDLITASGSDRIYLYSNVVFEPYRVQGSIYFDENQNGFYETNEVGISTIMVEANNSNYYSYNVNGDYFVDFPIGTTAVNTISPILSSEWGISSDSLSFTIALDSLNPSIDSLDFGLYPLTSNNSIENQIIGGYPVCNQVAIYWLNIANVGTTIPSGIIELALDNEVAFITSDPAPDSIVGQNIYWNYDSLFFFTDTTIKVFVQMPDFTSMGNELLSTLTTTVEDTSAIIYSVSEDLSQFLVCAYDPNDKFGSPLGNSDNMIPISTENLDYTIRFQNTGTDTARVIVVTDLLSSYLEINSVRNFSSSHQFEYEQDQNGLLKFTFNGINLPDSSTNFSESQGYINFTVDLKENLNNGTIIENVANIFFDLNPAVITNTSIHILSNSLSLFEETILDFGDLKIYPNPALDKITLIHNTCDQCTYSVNIIDYKGSVIKTFNNLKESAVSFDIHDLSSGIYIVQGLSDSSLPLFIGRVQKQ